MKHRILAMILALLIAFGATHMAFAAETPSDSTEISEECKERVYEEVLTGNITNHFDVLKVAVSQLPATAAYSADDEQELVINQELDTTVNPDGSVETEYASTALLVVDQDGDKVSPQTVSQYTTSKQGSGNMDEFAIYATHTMYYTVRTTNADNVITRYIEVQLSNIKTTLVYGTSLNAAKLVQTYSFFDGYGEYSNIDVSKEYPTPAAGTYNYRPDTAWHRVRGYQRYIESYGLVYAGTKVLTIRCTVELS